MFIPPHSGVTTCLASVARTQSPKKLFVSTFFLWDFGTGKTTPDFLDIVLPKYKTVIFVNGCFWHRHDGCKYFVWPKSNEEFWKDKILSNVERDKRTSQALKAQGWNVIVVWECELKKGVAIQTLQKLADEVRANIAA